VRWAFAAEDAITAAPTVVDGVVYVGSNDGKLYALAANTSEPDGELLWNYDAGAAISSDLALASGMVYLANSDDELRAVDARSGQERWRYSSSRTLYGAPLTAGDLLLINRGYDILALDTRSGTERSTTPTGDPPAYPSLRGDGHELFVGHRSGFLRVLGNGGDQPWAGTARWQAAALENQLAAQGDSLAVPLVRDGDRAIAVSSRGGVYAVTLADGSYDRLGQVSDIGAALLPPELAGDTLYLGDQFGDIVAFDLRERHERWRVDMGGRTFSPPAIADGRMLLAATSGKTAIAAAFDAPSGRRLWLKRFDFGFGLGSSGVLHDGRFYLAADTVYALDPTSGEVVWSAGEGVRPLQIAALDGTIYAVGFDSTFRPVLEGWDAVTGQQRLLTPLDLPALPRLHDGIATGSGHILLTLNDNTLLALDAVSGAERWRRRAASQLSGRPVVFGGAALVITQDNHLLARALADGRLLGDFALQNTGGSLLDSAMAPLVSDGRLYAAFYQSLFALTLKE
jgi:outer membrane protein assembly factor BamB